MLSYNIWKWNIIFECEINCIIAMCSAVKEIDITLANIKSKQEKETYKHRKSGCTIVYTRTSHCTERNLFGHNF